MQAKIDQNYIKSRLGVLNTDGITIIPIACNEVDGSMKINTTDTISFTMTPISPQDQNYVNCMLFVGSDGLTYPWVCNASGEVLVEL